MGWKNTNIQATSTKEVGGGGSWPASSLLVHGRHGRRPPQTKRVNGQPHLVLYWITGYTLIGPPSPTPLIFSPPLPTNTLSLLPSPLHLPPPREKNNYELVRGASTLPSSIRRVPTQRSPTRSSWFIRLLLLFFYID